MAGTLVKDSDKGTMATYESARNNKRVNIYYSNLYTNLEAFLAQLCKQGSDEKSGAEKVKTYALNILAARMGLDVEANNKDKLIATSTNGNDAVQKKEQIAAAFAELMDSPLLNEYLNSRTSEKNIANFKKLIGRGHGGAMERDLKKFVCEYKGPIPEDTPERYRPTALERIDALKARLEKLPKGSAYAYNAAKICIEVAAVRAAVNSVRGDKSSLKKTYDPTKVKQYCEGLEKAGILERMGNDPKLLERMVKGLLHGHGGRMDRDIQQMVLDDMNAKNRVETKVPTRYQVTYGQRLERVARTMRDLDQTLFKKEKLTAEQRKQFGLAVGEYLHLSDVPGLEMRERQEEEPDFDLRIDTSGDNYCSAKRMVNVETDDLDAVAGELIRNADARSAVLQATAGTDFEGANRLLKDHMSKARTAIAELNEKKAAGRQPDPEEYAVKTGKELRAMREIAINMCVNKIQTEMLAAQNHSLSHAKRAELEDLAAQRLAIDKAYVDCTKNGVTDEKKLAEELRAPKFWDNVEKMQKVPAVKEMFDEMKDFDLENAIKNGALADKLSERMQKQKSHVEALGAEKKQEEPEKDVNTAAIN